MVPAPRVARPPARPLLLFDGDCGFCRAWIARWRGATGDRVDYLTSQEAGERFPEIPAEAFRRSVQLVLPEGDVLSGTRAVFTALARGGRTGPLRAYEKVPGLAPAAEAIYSAVANHRGAASVLTGLLWGRDVSTPRFGIASGLFLRLVGVAFFCAFVSAALQMDGLVGSRGILPIARLLSLVRERYGSEGYRLLPTLAWLAPGDTALRVQCLAGAALSLVLAAGFFPALCLVLLTVLYLSVSVAGQTFFFFQWDYLLVETGFLALFLAPLSARIAFPAEGPRRMPLFLLRWLLFRLNFSSGVVKLASGDPAWRSLTALDYHYETQPLPTWTAWYAHGMPAAVHRASCVVLFFVELVVPFAIFGPRRVRLAACALLAGLQVAIAATGNYAFFNFLSIALCVMLLDDGVFERLRRRIGERRAARAPRRTRAWPRAVPAAVAILTVPLSFFEVAGSMRETAPPAPFVRIASAVSPFRIVNGYGLFAVMTTRRPEIVVEGSRDGTIWIPYEFRWKPGDPLRRPRFVAPHQPRLDWQMWFAALGSYDENPWFGRFLARLLEGSPDVLSLLASNPFPDAPPRFVRARLYDYRFTDAAERRRTGAWWRRVELGTYSPAMEGP